MSRGRKEQDITYQCVWRFFMMFCPSSAARRKGCGGHGPHLILTPLGAVVLHMPEKQHVPLYLSRAGCRRHWWLEDPPTQYVKP